MPDKDDSGDWQGLDSPRQAPRYAAIADIINSFRPNGDVLDIGCGEAVLLNYLQNNFNYHGIEPSAKAIRLALERNPTAKIYHSSSENFDHKDGVSTSSCLMKCFTILQIRLDSYKNTLPYLGREALFYVLFTKSQAEHLSKRNSCIGLITGDLLTMSIVQKWYSLL